MGGTEKKEALCLGCNKNVEYVIEEVDDSVELKGRTVFFRRQRAVCPECGSEIWVGAVDDRNIAAAREAYCRDRGVMTPKEVEAVTEKYDIGARPLAKLLGWGAVTIARFIAGDIPSKAYSDRLRELADDEDEYRELVEKNKHKISHVAYRKTMVRLDAGQTGGTAENVRYVALSHDEMDAVRNAIGRLERKAVDDYTKFERVGMPMAVPKDSVSIETGGEGSPRLVLVEIEASVSKIASATAQEEVVS